jgi:hypothetical protein
MAERIGLSSTIAIFKAESLCSPDDNAPWLDGSDPLRVAAKFRVPADIPLARAAAVTGACLHSSKTYSK